MGQTSAFCETYNTDSWLLSTSYQSSSSKFLTRVPFRADNRHIAILSHNRHQSHYCQDLWPQQRQMWPPVTKCNQRLVFSPKWSFKQTYYPNELLSEKPRFQMNLPDQMNFQKNLPKFISNEPVMNLYVKVHFLIICTVLAKKMASVAWDYSQNCMAHMCFLPPH